MTLSDHYLDILKRPGSHFFTLEGAFQALEKAPGILEDPEVGNRREPETSLEDGVEVVDNVLTRGDVGDDVDVDEVNGVEAVVKILLMVNQLVVDNTGTDAAMVGIPPRTLQRELEIQLWVEISRLEDFWLLKVIGLVEEILLVEQI